MKILFFAWLKNEIASEINIEIEKPISVSELKEKIINEFTVKANILHNESILVSINQEYKNNEDTVTNEDEVAFFPPVTGG